MRCALNEMKSCHQLATKILKRWKKGNIIKIKEGILCEDIKEKKGSFNELNF